MVKNSCKKILSTFLIVFLLTPPTFASSKCDPEKVLTGIYNSLGQTACFGMFGGNYEFGRKSLNLGVCAGMYYVAGAAVTTLARTPVMFDTYEDWGHTSRNTPRNRARLARVAERYRDFHRDTIGGNKRVIAEQVLEVFRTYPGNDASVGYSLRYMEQTHATKGPKKPVGAVLRFLQRAGVAGMFTGGLGAVLAIGVEVGSALVGATPTAACDGGGHLHGNYDEKNGCKLTMGPQTIQFLEMSTDEQKKILAGNPMLCENYNALAKELNDSVLKELSPEFDVKACASGKPSKVELKWRNGRTFDVQVSPNGDFTYTADNNQVLTNTIDMVTGSGNVPSISTVRTNRAGFAPRSISKSVFLSGARTQVFNDEDRKKFSEATKIAYAMTMLNQGPSFCDSSGSVESDTVGTPATN